MEHNKEISLELLSSKLDLVIQMLKQHDKRMDRIEHNQERLEHNQERLEDNQMADRKMIMDIWQSRHEVVAKMNWSFVWKAGSFNLLVLLLMFFILNLSNKI